MINRLVLTVCLVTALFSTTRAQDQKAPRKNNNWFNMDPDKDRFAGVSTDLTYTELLNGLSPDTVIVAVLDGGTDVRHPDLSAVIWVNEDEIPGNGVDDDKNGYIDDINGWNFLGSSRGNINKENLEITRQYRLYLDAKASGKKMTPEMKQSAKLYKKEKKEAGKIYNILDEVETGLKSVEASANGDSVRISHLIAYTSESKPFNRIRKMVITEMENGADYYDLKNQLLGAKGQYKTMLDYHLNLEFEARSIIGDDPYNYTDSLYGNNDVIGEDAAHGTHVAGIVAAVRDNEIGMNGISDAARIMVLRVVPDGDEYDKDIVNGIRYAVDNGAKIINMSFGKDLSPGKPELDAAFAYAASKDVLIVHASGNESLNIDKNSNYPSPYFTGTKNRIPGWLEVGANAANGYAGNFSNYGRRTVDLFAPGVNIYSTLPDSAYGHENGTSMAAPMVSGVAAILRSYFPQLTAEQVRNILIATVTKVPFDTLKPGSRKKKVGYSELCATAGIINVYKAVKMAQGIGNPK